MKKLILLAMVALMATTNLMAQVSINTDGTPPDASAMLDIKSTEKGLLLPRMTQAQMNGITNPAEGLTVYCTDCDQPGIYAYNGTSWGFPGTGATENQTMRFDGTDWVASSVLENDGNSVSVNTTTGGFVLPRMTYDEMVAIASPINGMLVWLTNINARCEYTGIWNCEDANPVDIYNSCDNLPTTTTVSFAGHTWATRNLGASGTPSAPHHFYGYGSLYQWGRGNDGHQCVLRNSPTGAMMANPYVYVQSATDNPGHSNTIAMFTDWRNPQNDNLWQGVSGTNNPCPTGFRLPTWSEFNDVLLALSPDDLNAVGAFDCPLVLTTAGQRWWDQTLVAGSGEYGVYWTGSVAGGGKASRLVIEANNMYLVSSVRGTNASVRCIQD